VGPDLTSAASRGAESILLAVVDPNREIHPQYVDYMVLTTDGQLHTGILAAESSGSLTLRRAGGVSETILRAHVDLVRSSDVSLMPEGLIDDLEPAAVADLLAFLFGEE
jgi:putative heme-binding domain-containing protein